jgi:hypothetical protein
MHCNCLSKYNRFIWDYIEKEITYNWFYDTLVYQFWRRMGNKNSYESIIIFKSLSSDLFADKYKISIYNTCYLFYKMEKIRKIKTLKVWRRMFPIPTEVTTFISNQYHMLSCFIKIIIFFINKTVIFLKHILFLSTRRKKSLQIVCQN